MKKKTLTKRILPACLATLTLLCLLCWASWSLLTGHLFYPSAATITRTAHPVVQAILEFKQQTGLWPKTLDELVPAYLPKFPPGNWRWNYPTLLTAADLPYTGVRYNFTPPYPGWATQGDFGKGPLSLPAPTTTRPAPTPDQQFKNALTILDARIHREPLAFTLYREKAIYLLHYHKTADALDVIEKAATLFPGNWWPPMARAQLAQGDAHTSAEAAFAAWASPRDNFQDHWYLYIYYRQHGQPDHALQALDDASAHRITFAHETIDSVSSEYMCINAATYACKMQKYELVLKICDQWSLRVKTQGYAGEHMNTFRAAASLGLGRIASAQMFIVHEKKGLDPSTDKLIAAIDAENQSFIYDAEESFPPPFTLFNTKGLDE